MDAFEGSFVRDHRVVVCAAARRLRDRCRRSGTDDIEMLAVVSRACSIVNAIAIYVWTRRAGLPRQRQPLNGRGGGNRPSTCRRRSCRGTCVPNGESVVEQQRHGEGDARQNSCPTMEVMVNAVMLSTDRAWTRFEISRARNPSKTHHSMPSG